MERSKLPLFRRKLGLSIKKAGNKAKQPVGVDVPRPHHQQSVERGPHEARQPLGHGQLADTLQANAALTSTPENATPHQGQNNASLGHRSAQCRKPDSRRSACAEQCQPSEWEAAVRTSDPCSYWTPEHGTGGRSRPTEQSPCNTSLPTSSGSHHNIICAYEVHNAHIRGRSNSTPTISAAGINIPQSLSQDSAASCASKQDSDTSRQRLETSRSHGHLTGISLTHKNMATIMERSGDWDSLEEIYTGPPSPNPSGSLRRSSYTSPSCGVRMAELRATRRSQDGSKSPSPSPEPHSPSPHRQSPSHSPQLTPQRYSPSFGFSQWGLETASRLQRPFHPIIEEQASSAMPVDKPQRRASLPVSKQESPASSDSSSICAHSIARETSYSESTVPICHLPPEDNPQTLSIDTSTSPQSDSSPYYFVYDTAASLAMKSAQGKSNEYEEPPAALNSDASPSPLSQLQSSGSYEDLRQDAALRSSHISSSTSPSQDTNSNSSVLCNADYERSCRSPQYALTDKLNAPPQKRTNGQGRRAKLPSASAISEHGSSSHSALSASQHSDRIYEKLSASMPANTQPVVVTAEANGDIYTPLANTRDHRERAANKPSGSRNKVLPPVARFRTSTQGLGSSSFKSVSDVAPANSSLSSSLNSSLTSVASASSESDFPSKSGRRLSKPTSRPKSDKGSRSPAPTAHPKKPQSAPPERSKRRQLPPTPAATEVHAGSAGLVRRGIPAPLDLHKRSGSTSNVSRTGKEQGSLGAGESAKTGRGLTGPPQSPRRRLSSGSLKDGRSPRSPLKTNENKEADSSIKTTSTGACTGATPRSAATPPQTRPTKLKLPQTPNEGARGPLRSRASTQRSEPREESTRMCSAPVETDCSSRPPGAENRSSQSGGSSDKKDASTNTKSVLQILRQRGLIGARKEASTGAGAVREEMGAGVEEVINATRRNSKEGERVSQERGAANNGQNTTSKDDQASREKKSPPPLPVRSLSKDSGMMMIRSSEERPKPRLVKPYASSLSRSHSPFSCKFGLKQRSPSPDKPIVSHIGQTRTENGVTNQSSDAASPNSNISAFQPLKITDNQKVKSLEKMRPEFREDEASMTHDNTKDAAVSNPESKELPDIRNGAVQTTDTHEEKQSTEGREKDGKSNTCVSVSQQTKSPAECSTQQPNEECKASKPTAANGRDHNAGDQTIACGPQGQSAPASEVQSMQECNAPEYTESSELQTTSSPTQNHGNGNENDCLHDNNNGDKVPDSDDDVFKDEIISKEAPPVVHVAMCYHSSLSRTHCNTGSNLLLPEFLGSKECARSHSENDCCTSKKKACNKTPVISVSPSATSDSDVAMRKRRVRNSAELQEVIQEGHEPWVIYHHQKESGQGHFSVIGNLRLSESGYDSWKSQDSGSTLAPRGSSQDDSETSTERLDAVCGALKAARDLSGSQPLDPSTLGSQSPLGCLLRHPSLKLDLVAKDTSHLGDGKWSSNDTLLANDAEVGIDTDSRSTVPGCEAADQDRNAAGAETGGSVPLGLESVLCGAKSPSEGYKGPPRISSCSSPACNTLPPEHLELAALRGVEASTDSNETIQAEEVPEGAADEGRLSGSSSTVHEGQQEERNAISAQLDQGERRSGAADDQGANMCETVWSLSGSKALLATDQEGADAADGMRGTCISNGGDYVETMREPFGKEDKGSNRSTPESNSLLTCSSHTYESIEDANMSTSTHSYESIEENAEWVMKLRQKNAASAAPCSSCIASVLKANNMQVHEVKNEAPSYEKCHSAPDIPRTQYATSFLQADQTLKRSGAVMTLNLKQDDGHSEPTLTLNETAVSESSLHADIADNYVAIEQSKCLEEQKVQREIKEESSVVHFIEALKQTPPSVMEEQGKEGAKVQLKEEWKANDECADATPSIMSTIDDKKKRISRSIPSLKYAKRPTSLIERSSTKKATSPLPEEKKKAKGSRALHRPLSLSKKDMDKASGALPVPSDSPMKRQSYPPINKASVASQQPPLSCPPAVPPRTTVFTKKVDAATDSKTRSRLPKKGLTAPRKWTAGSTSSTSRH